MDSLNTSDLKQSQDTKLPTDSFLSKGNNIFKFLIKILFSFSKFSFLNQCHR